MLQPNFDLEPDDRSHPSMGVCVAMDYPFPIRPGITAHLQLPVDLTTSESQRLANFIASLAIDKGVVDARAA
jgi:hypothetical protein